MRWLVPILLASLALDFTAIDHGDPIAVDRAIDAIHPLVSLGLTPGATEVATKYPPLQFRITGFVEKSWLVLTRGFAGEQQFEQDAIAWSTRALKNEIDWTTRDEVSAELRRLIVIGRGVSALMGTLLVLFLFWFAREIVGERAALIAAAFAAVNWPLVYYAHQLNVDVPYLAWSFLALWLVARAVRVGSPVAIVLAALAAACAIGTKDQAYGLFAFTAPVALYLYMRPPVVPPNAPGVRRPLPWIALVASLAVAAFVLLVLPDKDWLRQHWAQITGPGSEPYRSDPRTLAGQWTLLKTNAWLVALGVTWPAAIVALVSAVLFAVHAPKLALLALAPFVSYVATFLFPAGFTYLRFTIPLQLLLLVPLGAVLAHGIASARSRVSSFALLAVLFGMNAWSAIGVDRFLLADDTRSRAEHWLRENCTKDTRIHAVLDAMGVNVILPPWPGVTMQNPGPPPPVLDKAPPDVIVVSFFEYFDPSSATSGDRKVDPVMRRFGRKYDLVEDFEPPFPHVIRSCVAAMPIVWIYRAAN